MQIDSLSYLLLFLPLTAAGFFLLPARARSGWLLVVSLLFYALLQPWYLPLMLGDLWLCFKLAPLVKAGGRSAKHALYGAVVANLFLLVVASGLNQIYQYELPFGLFLYTLTALGYLLDVQSGEAAPEESFVRFAAACCFYPKLYAGPLVPYQSLAQDLRRADVSVSQVGVGLARFIRGLAKKVIIAGAVTALLTQIKAFPAEEQTVLSVWTLVVCASFSAYFTLSGYCDMAQG